jgi:hypothetical protein
MVRALAGSFVPSQREFSSIPAALGFDRHFLARTFGACGAAQKASQPSTILDHDVAWVREAGTRAGAQPVSVAGNRILFKWPKARSAFAESLADAAAVAPVTLTDFCVTRRISAPPLPPCLQPCPHPPGPCLPAEASRAC